MTQPTIHHAKEVLELLSHGLINGLGEPEPGKMCIEAVITHVLGEGHHAEPSCVGRYVRKCSILLNDMFWSSPLSRSEGMKRIAVAQLGSDRTDQGKFLALTQEKIIARILPMVLRNLDPYYARYMVTRTEKQLEAIALRCQQEGGLEAAEAARIFCASTFPGGELHVAVRYALDAEDTMYTVGYASRQLNDKPLLEAARIIEEALVELGSPGSKWLGLC